MTDNVVFFSKHDILNVSAVHLVNVYPPKMYHIKEVLHKNWPFRVAVYSTLYNHFCILSFHSVLCFLNDYYMVKVQ